MWVTGAKQPPESDFWEIGGFFAFPADYFRQFPMYAHVVKACSVFVKPPVSAVFRSFSAVFPHFSAVFGGKLVGAVHAKGAKTVYILQCAKNAEKCFGKRRALMNGMLFFILIVLKVI